MNDNQSLKRTCLHARHLDLGARMVPFGGYEMPIQYSGIVEEHQAARQAAAVFDTCHMGELRLSGPTAVADLERLLSCDIADLRERRCRYGLLCNEEGGVIDDLLVYRFTEDEFMLVVNAGTQDRDRQWLLDRVSSGTRLVDESADTAKIDLQGPRAPAIAAAILEKPIDDMVFYSFGDNWYGQEKILISRTGYTGEVGFEFYCSVSAAVDLWDACLQGGAIPAGLGARDTLRLELGMPLYGHELSSDRNAGEAGFQRAIAGSKDFIGADKVRDESLCKQKLCGLAIPGRRAAREGNQVMPEAGRESIGVVTSGSFAPSLGHAVALAYLDRDKVEIGDPVRIVGERRELSGRIVELPFYRQGTARGKLKRFLV